MIAFILCLPAAVFAAGCIGLMILRSALAFRSNLFSARCLLLGALAESLCSRYSLVSLRVTFVSVLSLAGSGCACICTWCLFADVLAE